MSAVMEESQQKESTPTYWECTVCSNWVVLHVEPSNNPVCRNPKHSTKTVTMVEKPAPKGRIKK